MVDKISYKFDPEELTGLKIPAGKRRQVKMEIADFIEEKVLSAVGEAKSPVAGESWKRSLNKDYRKFKGEHSSSTIANMELTGDMLDAHEVIVVGGRIEQRIKGKQADKADGHNQLTGRSTHLPKRRFIPGPNQKYKKGIRDGIKDIILEAQESVQESPSRSRNRRQPQSISAQFAAILARLSNGQNES